MQIFFLGSLFFTVAALTRKIFVVYLQGVAVFMAWIIGVTVYGSTRALEHFWSGILDPLGNITLDNVARYWTVAEKNTLLLPWDLHSGYTRRGSDVSLEARTHLARMRALRLAPAFVGFAMLAAAAGGWFYYNAHVLNRYTTAKMRWHEQAQYEVNYRQYRGVPQLKVTAVDNKVDIGPYQRSMHAVGVFTLQNKTGKPIQEIHLSSDWDVEQNIRFDRPAQATLTAPLNQYTIYQFATPVAPGDVVTMTADMRHVTRGFRDGNEPPQYAYNGTFFDNGIFPTIGYQDGNELADPRRRREEKLGPLHEMAERGDPFYGRQNLFTGQQANWITYHTVVSTSPDQIALSPGYLQREWQANGRRYFEYSMGSPERLRRRPKPKLLDTTRRCPLICSKQQTAALVQGR